MSVIQGTQEEIVSMALELASPSLSKQAEYLSKLKHYQDLISEASQFRHQVSTDIRIEEVKQGFFQVINNLIKENMEMQHKITHLQDSLTQAVTNLGEARRVKNRCIHLEEQLKRSKEKVEDMRYLEETIGKVKHEIRELIEDKHSLEDRHFEDECGVLNGERSQLMLLRRAVEARMQDLESSWMIMIEATNSMNTREVSQIETITIMTQLINKQKEQQMSYKEVIRDISVQEQKLIHNYQSQIIQLTKQLEKYEGNVQNGIQSLEVERERNLTVIKSLEESCLRQSELGIKISALEREMKEVVMASEVKRKELESGAWNKCEFADTLEDLQHHNQKIMFQLNLVKEERKAIEGETTRIKNENSLLSQQLRDMDKLVERANKAVEERNRDLLEVKKEVSEVRKELSEVRRQTDKGTVGSNNLEKQIRLLSDINNRLSAQSVEAKSAHETLRKEYQKVSENNCALMQEMERLKKEREVGRRESVASAVVDAPGGDLFLEGDLNCLNEIIYHLTFHY